MNHVIDVQGLTKDYGQGRGIFDLTFQVERVRSLVFWDPMAQEKPPLSAILWALSVPRQAGRPF